MTYTEFIKYVEKHTDNVFVAGVANLFDDYPSLKGFIENSSFTTAPASTKYHGNYTGGLLEHSVNVMYILYTLTENNHMTWGRPESPIIVGLFHDICKTDQYICTNDDVNKLVHGHSCPYTKSRGNIYGVADNYICNDPERDIKNLICNNRMCRNFVRECDRRDAYYKQNIEYDYNNETLLKGHGDKSVMMLASLMQLTEEEAACIRYHMGAFTSKEEWNDYTRAIHMYPNVLWTHQADMIATHIKEVQNE